MMDLQELTESLDNFFNVKAVSRDPQMGLFLPAAYESIHYDWQNLFEKDFVKHLNGLMIKGTKEVNQIFLCSFPILDVLDRFLAKAKTGDLLFSHHPIYMECGDPKNGKGRGWMPIPDEYWKRFKDQGLSYYSCHSPMDYHLQVGTKAAMINSLNAIYIEDCFFDGVGSHGAICAIESIKLGILKEKLLKIFGIDYLDLAGNQDDERVISKIMLVAGGGDNTEQMQIAENQKVELFLAGEFNSRFTTEWAYKNQKLVDNFLQKTKMSMVGVSHSGCEYLTMKMQMPNFFRAKYSLETTLLPQKKWWL